MKILFFSLILTSQLAFSVELPNSYFLHDIYGQQMSVLDLKNGDKIRVLDNNQQPQETKVENVYTGSETVTFDLLDGEINSTISNTSAKQTHKSARSRLHLSKVLLPGALLAMACFPVVEAGPGAAGIYSVVGVVVSVGAGIATTVVSGGNVAAGVQVAMVGIEFIQNTAPLVVLVPAP